MDLDAIIDNVYLLPQKSKDSLKASISEVTYARGHLLFKVNKISSDIYFIKKGMVRAYAETADNEVTFWFGKEGDTVIAPRDAPRYQIFLKRIIFPTFFAKYALCRSDLISLCHSDCWLFAYAAALACTHKKKQIKK